MKRILFFISFLCLLLYSVEKSYLLDNQKIEYNDTQPSFTIIDISTIKEKEIVITYKFDENFIHNETELYYDFLDNYTKDNNDNDFKVEKSISFYRRYNSNNKLELYYKITKERKKYLVLANFLCQNSESIEVDCLQKRNDNKNNKIIIIIIIISITLVVGIIVGFILVGKYLFNKRQKEIMAKYNSSFVEENPSLIPNDKENNPSNNDKIDD